MMTLNDSILCPSSAFADLSAGILRAGRGLRFQAHGDSMYPLLRDGDVLLVRPLDGQSVNIGDAVLCSIAPGRIVVHRVVRKLAGPSGYDFLVQGDHVMRPDGVISHKQVYGRVASIERDGAHINVNNPVMRILSGFAVLRSLWSVGRTRKLPLTLRLIKRLPGLSSYLA